DLVVHRTAGCARRHRAGAHAVRNAAIHAARRLVPRRLLGERDHELLEMADAVGRRLVATVLTIDLEKTGDLAHPCLFLPIHTIPPPPPRAARSGSRSPSSRRARGGTRPASPCGI